MTQPVELAELDSNSMDVEEPQKDDSTVAPKPNRASTMLESTPTQMLMKPYYSRLFPWKQMYRWLAYGNDGKGPQCDASYFKRRELCFTLDGDIFVRYQTFQDGRELHQALKARAPAKIDIGPVYTQDPAKRAAYKGESGARAFRPVERELVFDIDLTDYDDVRNSGSGTSMSSKCWILMAIAIKILNRGLRDDLGFEDIFFVFSGRRGIHCWVCDARARRLTDEQRSAISRYFGVYAGQEKGLPKLILASQNHPAVEAAYGILQEHWQQVLVDQQLLTTPRTQQMILQYVPDAQVAADLHRRWQASPPAGMDTDANIVRWQELLGRSEDRKLRLAWDKALQQIMFAFAYPRLDMEVTKKMNHLLKAPFCVHPKTGKLCVPIDPECALEFDPEAVPTVQSCLQDLDSNPPLEDQDDLFRTSLGPYVTAFEKSFLEPLEQRNKEAMLATIRSERDRMIDW